MRFLVVALLLCSAGATLLGQSIPEAKKQDPLFQAPPLAPPAKPEFKLNWPQAQQLLPATPPKSSLRPNIDRQILRTPQGFAHRPARPAPRNDLYPGLKIQPTEIALVGGTLCPNAELKFQPIPRTFPEAKVEPIPTTAECLKMLPVLTPPGSATP